MGSTIFSWTAEKYPSPGRSQCCERSLRLERLSACLYSRSSRGVGFRVGECEGTDNYRLPKPSTELPFRTLSRPSHRIKGKYGGFSRFALTTRFFSFRNSYLCYWLPYKKLKTFKYKEKIIYKEKKRKVLVDLPTDGLKRVCYDINLLGKIKIVMISTDSNSTRTMLLKTA